MNKLLNDSSLSATEREREFEDAIAHRYNRDYHAPPIMQTHSKAFVEFANTSVFPGARILDLGCASASLWEHFLEIFPNDVQLAGVDLSPKMLDEARRLFPKGEFKIGELTSIPYESGAFDIVIVSSAFHHINDSLLPQALKEIERVLDEHGTLVGREPLKSGRLPDRGGWVSGAMMHLRHLAYRLSNTQEFPEPDAGPDHHAYDAKEFLSTIDSVLKVARVEFRNPASLFLARCQDSTVSQIAEHLDTILSHKEGQEVHYAASRNFSEASDVNQCIINALSENKIVDVESYLIHVAAAAKIIEEKLLLKTTK